MPSSVLTGFHFSRYFFSVIETRLFHRQVRVLKKTSTVEKLIVNVNFDVKDEYLDELKTKNPFHFDPNCQTAATV